MSKKMSRKSLILFLFGGGIVAIGAGIGIAVSSYNTEISAKNTLISVNQNQAAYITDNASANPSISVLPEFIVTYTGANAASVRIADNAARNVSNYTALVFPGSSVSKLSNISFSVTSLTPSTTGNTMVATLTVQYGTEQVSVNVLVSNSSEDMNSNYTTTAPWRVAKTYAA
ncbi:hypothetical protein EI74_0309 [Mycoplasma testudineum]|uniref:Uncharacterized protein n=1 Tax=Mycoplasma testudineum TaxID=244584 RepID=A0A4V3C327_9MOLU|nr:hypothetical protein [Mycoplasma testudineum]OYD26930.1 hypothetical protein CG473_01155 [Mycoplasma testudineum]TDO20479.1 hypothetical protein EI74_0309 [Mycoplasma testudineum]